ncbi:hypothetical protein BDN72DRAFT_843602 [Pluteus cervinus]|uniref:Uncharacterized protein n=1 Tax=Pluteus cervinus TaxID=181527 RepID=A0ACD3AMP4_9AGAR|nr:hypothetical protein BDN72DRAFT_843602 [Pluteus cervinus]
MKLGPDGKCITSTDEIQRQLEEGMFLCRNWPFPFDAVEDDELLLELGNTKPRVGVEYTRRYNVDTTFNVMKAAIMRTERVKSKSRLTFKDLGPLLNMPVEIFLEVIEHLHPLDLYHLSKTCNAMNDFIQRHSALWLTVWRSHSVPPPPPSFSFPRWAEFLFGPAICDVCQNYVALPDFVHLKRYCTTCMLFWCQWEELQDPVLRSLVPASKRRLGWVLQRPNPTLERCGREMQRVQAMAERLDRIRELLDYDEDGAEDAFIDFITTAKEETDSVIRHAEDCQRWAYNLFEELEEDVSEKQFNMLRRLQRRLLASSEGFKPLDVDGFQHELHVLWFNYSLRDLKRRSFNRCVPHLIATARSRRESRLLSEHKQLRERRRVSLELAYNDHLQTNVTPSLWRTYPPVEVFWFMDVCRRLIYDDGHEEVTQKKGREVVLDMERAGVFGEWYGIVRKEIGGTIPPIATMVEDSLYDDDEDGDENGDESGDGDGDGKMMNLVTSVFSCMACWQHYRSYDFNQTGTVMFGWDGVKDHVHCVHARVSYVEQARRLLSDESETHSTSPSSESSSSELASSPSPSPTSTSTPTPTSQPNIKIPTRITYNQTAADVVKMLLKRLDLSEEETTVDELDRLDGRFMFEKQWECVLPHTEGREVLTWRECVMTILRFKQKYPDADLDVNVGWTILPPAQMVFVKSQERENPDSRIADKAWSCAYCGGFFNNLASRGVVLHHLQIQHNIDQPNLETDIIYLPREERTPRQPILLAPLHPFDYNATWTTVIPPRGKTEDVLRKYYIGNSMIEQIYPLVSSTHPKFTGQKWVGWVPRDISTRRRTNQIRRDVVSSLVYWMEVQQGLPRRSDPSHRLEFDPLDYDDSFQECLVKWNPRSSFGLEVNWSVLWRRLVWRVWRCGDGDEARLERYWKRVMNQPGWCLSEGQVGELVEALMVDHSSSSSFGGVEEGLVAWGLIEWVVSWFVGLSYGMALYLGGVAGGAFGMWFVLAYM